MCRIVDEWNLEAIHRAGADFALSHGSLAAKSVLSEVQANDLIVLGEGADIFIETVPTSLSGKTLAESGIGAQTGLNLIAIRSGEASTTNPAADTLLTDGAELVMLGAVNQYQEFMKRFA